MQAPSPEDYSSAGGARGNYFSMVKSQLAGDASKNSDAVPAAAAAALPSTPPVGTINASFLDLDASAARPHPSRGGLVQISGSEFGDVDVPAALGSPTLRRLPSEGRKPETLHPQP
jgi:hypothetical protein